MLVSSSIVGLALIGQVTHFDGRFLAFALVLLGMLVVIGTLTQLRVGNAAIEDLAHVIGMNRLRAGYVAIDPGIERYLVTSPYDDNKGVWQTYNHLVGPRTVMQPLASSGTFITFVTASLTAAFGAVVAVTWGAPGPVIAILAAAAGVIYVAVSVMLGVRQYQHIKRSTRFPTP